MAGADPGMSVKGRPSTPGAAPQPLLIGGWKSGEMPKQRHGPRRARGRAAVGDAAAHGQTDSLGVVEVRGVAVLCEGYLHRVGYCQGHVLSLLEGDNRNRAVDGS